MAREERENGLGSARPTREKGKSRPARMASRPPAAQVSSFFFFSYMNLFSKPFKIDFKSKSNKTKTTPLNKTNATA
jgi:hypothetical protein